MIYAQYRILYEIIHDAPSSNHDPKFKLGPHNDEVIGSASAKVVDQATTQLQNLSINQSAAYSTQSSYVHSVLSKNTKGNQQPRGNNNTRKNRRGGNNDRENAYNHNNNNNAIG